MASEIFLEQFSKTSCPKDIMYYENILHVESESLNHTPVKHGDDPKLPLSSDVMTPINHSVRIICLKNDLDKKNNINCVLLS